MKPLKPYQVLSKAMKPGPGRGDAGRYSLLAFATPGGRRFFFISAYRRAGRREELEVSPVISSSAGHAVEIFERLTGDDPVAPVHLVDVTYDLRLGAPELPAGGAVGTLS